MPKLTEQKNGNKAPETLQAMEDEELDAVVGGYEVVFQDNGVNHDSWFASLMMRRMIQDSIRRGLASPTHAAPSEISVGDRRFRVRQLGENYYVEEIRA